jgi:hypothetical protein
MSAGTGGDEARTAGTGVAGQGQQSSAGTPGTGEDQGPRDPVPTWAEDKDIGFYGRATFAISSKGVVPEWGVIITDGALTPRELKQGPMLVVGLLDDVVRSTVTALDPREVHGIPDPASGMAFGAMLDEGQLTVSFPGQHVQTRAHLRASRFEVYVLGNVPYDIAVTPENIAALCAGATLLGTAEGAGMLDLYF